VRALGAGADGEAIAFNPDDGKIYHWSGGTSFFESVSLVEPYEVTPLSSTFNREVFGAWWNPASHDFFVFDISSAGRRFFVDGTFEAGDLVASLPDDLRGPAFLAAPPHQLAPASGDVAGGTVVTLEGAGFTALSSSLGGASPTVSFGGATATGTIVDDRHLTVTAPASGVLGPVDVAISSGSYRYLWRQAFTYSGTLP
jgi:IPT/TIG domain